MLQSTKDKFRKLPFAKNAHYRASKPYRTRTRFNPLAIHCRRVIIDVTVINPNPNTVELSRVYYISNNALYLSQKYNFLLRFGLALPKETISEQFLDAPSHLSKRVYPSIGLTIAQCFG